MLTHPARPGAKLVRTGVLLSLTVVVASAAQAQTLKWHKKIGYCASPTVADVDGDDTLDLVLGTSGMLYALNGETGETFWHTAVGGDILTCPAIADVDNDARIEVVFGCTDRRVTAVDLETGEPRWSFRTRREVTSSPVIADVQGDGTQEILFGSQDGQLYMLAGRGGKLWWSKDLRAPVSASPAVADVNGDGIMEAFVCADDGNFYALNAKDGRVLWSNRVGIRNARSVALAPLTDEPRWGAFISAGVMRLMEAGREKRVWSFSGSGDTCASGSPAIADLNGDGQLDVVFGADDGNVYALAGLTGEKLWEARVSPRVGVESCPAIADVNGDGSPDVLIASPNRRLFCLDGKTGSPLWSQPLAYQTAGSPVVAEVNRDGKLAVGIGTEDGEFYLYACEASGQVLWAKARGDGRNTGAYPAARSFGKAMVGVPRR